MIVEIENIRIPEDYIIIKISEEQFQKYLRDLVNSKIFQTPDGIRYLFLDESIIYEIIPKKAMKEFH